jgi:hypothetical protein
LSNAVQRLTVTLLLDGVYCNNEHLQTNILKKYDFYDISLAACLTAYATRAGADGGTPSDVDNVSALETA